MVAFGVPTIAANITPFITFPERAEQAAELYVSIFDGSKIMKTTRYSAGAPMPEGSVMTVELELAGQRLVFLNGGSYFQLTDAFSLSISCSTQQEVDELTRRLTDGGGEVRECGWLTDRFGLRWQVTPKILMDLIGDPDRAKAQRVMAAMLTMKKIDIAALERAARG